jgi:hypothetical protein
MLLKTICINNPTTRNGRCYPSSDIKYFWTKLETLTEQLPPGIRQDIRFHIPSKQLRRAVLDLVGKAGVFTLTGRLRAKASYTARHNTVFQGLAADGAKLALWKLWRAGYRIVNFIHDQVLIEIPACQPQQRMQHAQTIRRLMIEGMREVVPDVRIEVNFAASNRWYASAEAITSDQNTALHLWHPTPAMNHPT